jgi:hypothetical protein
VKKRLDLEDKVTVHHVQSSTNGKWYIELVRKWGANPETHHVRSKQSVASYLAEWSPYEEAEVHGWLDRALAKSTDRPKEEQQTPTRGFAALPYLVLDRLLPVMPDAAFKVYCALLRFESYKSRQMWPGYDRLAEMTGLAAVTIWRSAKLLREAGLVRSRRRFGTSNLYEHVTVTSKNVEEIEMKLRARPIHKMSASDKKRVRGPVPSRSEGSVPSRMKG